MSKDILEGKQHIRGNLPMPMRILHSSARSPELRELEEVQDGSWLYVVGPSDEELHELSEQYDLEEDLLRDGIDPNESPRIERDNGSIYIYTRYSLPEDERLTTSTLLLVYTGSVLITVSNRPFPTPGQLMRDYPDILTSKRAQLVLAILNEINVGYKRRINQVSRRIWQLRGQLQLAQIENRDFVSFIDIEEDLNDFLLVFEPMGTMLQNLLAGRYMRLYEDDRDLIEDLTLGTDELIRLASSRLTTIRNIRDTYSAISTNNLNKIVRLMTAVTIMIGFFTLVTGFYGMNVPLPLSKDPSIYLVIIAFMIVCVAVLMVWFRKKKWL